MSGSPWLLALIPAALALPAGAQSFTATLSGGQAVPPARTTASGACTAVALEVDDGLGGETIELSVSCVHDVENPLSASVQLGRPGEIGPVILLFEDAEEPAGRFELTSEIYAYLLTESLYVGIQSVDSPAGEIRGQLRYASAQSLEGADVFHLDGDQVAPPVATDAAGTCLIRLTPTATETLDLFLVCHYDVDEPIAAHIHQAPPGENGPLLVDLGEATSPLFFELELDDSAGLIEPILAGELDLYVQIHTAEHRLGEIRGQIATGCVEGPTALCLGDGRFRVEATWRDFEGRSGPARAVRESLDSGILWFFDPDNAEILVKVLDACNLDPFNSFWVFYAATTNVEFTLTVTDTESGEIQEYSNPLGQAAPPVLDTAAFATCP